MDLISVIVPVYNVEEYMCECVDSVCSQTYRHLEIILVDDGSADGCPALCDDYALKDRRIKVIHQRNRGLSEARNIGYEASNGKYIAFVDADDITFDTYIEELYRLITKNNAQIAACAYTRVLREPEAGDHANAESYVITSGKMLKEWHGRRKKIETVVWNKLYNRQIFADFKGGNIFPEGKTHEDVYTSHLLAATAETIAVTDKKLYYYRRREASISRACTKEAAKGDLEAQRARLRFFRENKFYGAYFRLLVGHWMHRGMYVWKALWN